jgi:hypothetical protein
MRRSWHWLRSHPTNGRIRAKMVAAGVVALLNSEWRYDECDASEAVTLVYLAMALEVPSRKGGLPHAP